MRTYEMMVIHRPDLAEDDVRSRVKGLEESLAGKGATVAESDFWGKRRFAYEIDHLTEGYYTVLTFDADSPVIDELDRTMSLTDEVVRHKIIRPEAH